MSTATKATPPAVDGFENQGYLDTVDPSATAPVTPPPVPGMATVSTGRTVQEQTQRYYDRKFNRDSKDPAAKMQARRIDASAPVVDGSNNLRSSSDPRRPAPVVFPAQGGHSEWSPY